MARTRRNWTPEEDSLLRTAVHTALAQSRPLLWRELAKSVPGRSNKDCRRRWWNSLADGTAKGPWSEEEDERLTEAVRKHGSSWSRVAQAVGSRNPDQCASHWSQVLDPAINYCDWLPEEDARLLNAVVAHGTNWTRIAASHVPKRTTLALKNRYSTLRLRRKKSEAQGTDSQGESPPLSHGSPINSVLPGSEDEPNKGRYPQDHREGRVDKGQDGVDGEMARYHDGHREDTDSNLSTAQLVGTPGSMRVCLAQSHPRDSELPGSEAAWTEFAGRGGLLSPSSLPYGAMTPPLSGDDWHRETAGQGAYDTFYSSSYPSSQLGSPPGALFGALLPDLAATGTQQSLVYTSYTSHAGTDVASTMNLSSSRHYHLPGQAGPLPPHSDEALDTEIIPSIPVDTSTGSALENFPDQAQENLNYQLTLNVICTGSQVESVVARLREMGNATAIKIEPLFPAASQRSSKRDEEASKGG